MPPGIGISVIFEGETKYPCEEIRKGSAEIRRLISKPSTELGLNLVVSETNLYPIDLEAGKEIIICFGFFHTIK